MSLTILTILYDITCNNATYDNILVLKLLYDAIDNSMTSIQYHYQYFTMILMIYINDSNIFILIYPCYIYFFIDFIVLCYISGFHAASSMTRKIDTRHEHIYCIYLPILSMLSSGTCFQLSIPFMAPMLLYFYMIHIAFVSWLWCFPLSHTHVSTYTHILCSLYTLSCYR